MYIYKNVGIRTINNATRKVVNMQCNACTHINIQFQNDKIKLIRRFMCAVWHTHCLTGAYTRTHKRTDARTQKKT